MKLIYVAGPYSQGDKEENIAIARSYAIRLWQAGFAVVCPHLNTLGFETRLTYDQIMCGDYEIVSRCDGVFCIPQWLGSRGARGEIAFAKKRNIPVFENIWSLTSGWVVLGKPRSGKTTCAACGPAYRDTSAEIMDCLWDDAQRAAKVYCGNKLTEEDPGVLALGALQKAPIVCGVRRKKELQAIREWGVKAVWIENPNAPVVKDNTEVTAEDADVVLENLSDLAHFEKLCIQFWEGQFGRFKLR